MSEAKEFVTKGPITDPDKQIYIERPEDADILKAVRRGDYVTLLGARQTGKTSLLYKLARELKTEIPVFVDLSSFSGVKEDDWYDRVARTVVRRLPQELRDAVGKMNSCVDQEQFRNLLWEIANASAGTDRLVFLLDEMGIVPEEIRDDFFSTIRAIYNERGFEKAFQKYIFVLSGATPPAELISPDSKNSPFNVSQSIYIGDFSLEGVRQLGENLRLHGFKVDDSVIEHIYDWTNGHPNLTQEIFTHLVQAKPEIVTKEVVDDSVDELIAKGCYNLNRILRHVQDEAIKQKVFGILNGKLEIPFSLSNPEILNFYLIGVIREGTEGICVIRNNIYAKVLRSILPPIEKQKISIPEPIADRATLALVFTDIVGSTELGNKLGNEAMNRVRRAHFKRARNLIEKYKGCEIKTVGDEFMVTFPTAVDALDFTLALHADTGHEWIKIRAGIHVGQVTIDEKDVYGVMVNYTARVESEAKGPEIWVSNRAKSDIDDENAERHRSLCWVEHPDCELKGFPGKHRLWSIVI